LARIIGLDLGKTRTGIAVTDPTQTIVSPIGTITAKNEEDLTSNIKTFVDQYEPESVVVGIPRSMDGSAGTMAKWADRFRRLLEKELNIPVKGWDERMSTVAAKRILHENTSSEENSYGEDAISAAVILESYMAHQNRKK